MLKRVLCSVSTKLKNLMMAESAVSQAVTNEVTADKRLLTEDDAPSPTAKKLKVQHAAPMEGRADRKRKVALLIAYCGAGYYGIQIQMNGHFKTIESEILKALVAAELIPQDHADTPKKMSLQRAARTDKNVSAVGNILSLKMLYGETVPEQINSHLPPEIRIIGCMRTTRGFDSKTHCTARTYKYMLPTYSFAPVEKYITKEYRLPDADKNIQKVNEVLTKYVGTHNFHNFTSGRKPHEDSSKRYIKSFQCGEPFMRDGMEFAVLTVTGQSFMLHHIRKMIGLMIAIVRGYCGEDVLTKSWGPRKMDIPKAPGMGLFLDELFFEGYNKKFGNDGMHEPLVWDKYRESLDKFREEHVLSHIARSEVQESVMLQWLGTLQYHKFDFIDLAEEVPPDGEKEKDPTWYKTKALLRKVDQKKNTTEAEKSADLGTTATANESVNSVPEHENMGTPSSEQTTSGKEETSLLQQEEPMVIADLGDTSSVSVEQAQAPPQPMIITNECTDMSSTEQGLVLPNTPAVSGGTTDASTSHAEPASLLPEKPAVTAESSDTPRASGGPASVLQQEHTGSVTAQSGEASEEQTTASQEKPVVSSEADAKAENEKDQVSQQS